MNGSRFGTSSRTLWGRLARVPAGRLTKWLVLAAWVALVVIVGPLGSRLTDIQENDAVQFLPRGAESTRVADLQEKFANGEDPPAVVVYVRESGITEPDQRLVKKDAEELSGLDHVGQVEQPVPAEDGAALLLTVPLELPADDDEALGEAVEQVREEVSSGAPEGLQAKVTGPAGSLFDSISVFESLDATLLLVTASVVTLLLLLIYRSPLLWLLPLIGVAVASQVANAVVYLLARYASVVVDGQSAGILTVLVFGAGTDYALLLVARYREELHRYADRHEAMGVAIRRAGPAILASAATVAAGLLCLLVADLNSNRGLGPVGAAGIACAFLAMTMLLPAMLVVLGRWVFWPFVPRPDTPIREETTWSWVGSRVARRPRTIWITTAILLAIPTVGILNAETGLSMEGMYRTTPDSVAGQELIADHYPAGSAEPAYVVARASTKQEVADAARNTSGVSEVLPANRDGALAQIPVVLEDPPDSAVAEQTIERLRENVDKVDDAKALVGGTTATNLDLRDASAHDRRTVIPLVMAVVFVILALLLRALVAPLLLVATTVLSFFGALGASILIFEHLFGFGALDHSLVLLGFVFLVALGVDYSVFLMTRVREETGRIGHHTGVLRGLGVTGGVITSAGLVLAATFSVLTVFPLVSLVQLGFLVASGVLIDTFVVRSILIPALALDVGPKIWWPGQLAYRREGRIDEVHPAELVKLPSSYCDQDTSREILRKKSHENKPQ